MVLYSVRYVYPGKCAVGPLFRITSRSRFATTDGILIWGAPLILNSRDFSLESILYLWTGKIPLFTQLLFFFTHWAPHSRVSKGPRPGQLMSHWQFVVRNRSFRDFPSCQCWSQRSIFLIVLITCFDQASGPMYQLGMRGTLFPRPLRAYHQSSCCTLPSLATTVEASKTVKRSVF